MPQNINFNELKYASREDLFNSYRSRGRDYPVLPQDCQTEDIQNSMDASHTGDPLRHRAGFLYDENESLPVIPHWLGVELEVEPSPLGIKTPGFFYKVASTVNKHTIIKPDGSLGAGGFEICSVPATLKKHYELWESFFEKASPLLHSWGTGRCGMHVHLNKAFYADSAMGKALVFINSTENRPFIELVAGRSSNSYMKLYPKKIVDYRTGNSTGHYDALSISRHQTLELRIFRGNVRKAGFFKNLEFADAMGHFVHDTSLKALTSKDFLAWLAQDNIRSRYPYLIGWALTQKLFEPKKGDKIPLKVKKFSAPQTVKAEFLETVAA
jgi:hypothetical protein